MLGGTGWYRKAFTLPSAAADKVVSVDFDGVYMNATVYLNGEKLGTHPYGYTPFSFVLPTGLLKTNGEENVLAVKVENKLPSSRWYSGSGIYRDVKLTVTDSVHVSYFGTAVTTPDIEEGTGTVKVATSVKNDSDAAWSWCIQTPFIFIFWSFRKNPLSLVNSTQRNPNSESYASTTSSPTNTSALPL